MASKLPWMKAGRIGARSPGGDQGDARLQGLKAAIRGTPSLGKDQDVASFVIELHEPLQGARGRGVVRPRNGHGAEGTDQGSQKPRTEEFLLGKVAEAPREKRLHDEGIEVAGMVAG